MTATERFEPPVYPYDRLDEAKQKAAALPGGLVDLSIGTPTDPPPAAVVSALAGADDAGVVRAGGCHAYSAPPTALCYR